MDNENETLLKGFTNKAYLTNVQAATILLLNVEIRMLRFGYQDAFAKI
jgi:hypothetical protein